MKHRSTRHPMLRARIETWIGGRSGGRLEALIGILCAGLIAPAVLAGCRKQPELLAQVECSRNEKGMACRVRHTKGKKTGSVCWDLTASCGNGTKVLGSGCQVVAVKASATAQIPADELENLAQCDRVVKTEVSNVRMLETVD